jgi:hypothetical protein
MDWQPRIKPPPSVHELITDDGMPMESNSRVEKLHANIAGVLDTWITRLIRRVRGKVRFDA